MIIVIGELFIEANVYLPIFTGSFNKSLYELDKQYNEALFRESM